MSENFKPIDFSKYAELRDLWNMHPSNTEGALYKGYKPAEGETSQVLRRYGELTKQLSDEVGSQNNTEAMIALGGVGGIGNGLTGENLGDPNYYENIMGKRKEFLAQGRSVEEADAIEAFRLASILTGERQPDLNYVQADRARRYYSQYGTPEQIDYTNQLATQLRSAQPQGMLGQFTQPQAAMQQPMAQPQAAMQQPLGRAYTVSTMSQPQQIADQSSFRLHNMVSNQYNQPSLQGTEIQEFRPQDSFVISNMLGGNYFQPHFQNGQFTKQAINPNQQTSQLNLNQPSRGNSLSRFLV